MAIRTPDEPAGGIIYECRRLRVPANVPQLRAAIIGAIIDMVHGQEWEQFGNMTIDDVIQVMFEAIISTSELCEDGYVIGEIRDFMLDQLPAGWLECDGSVHLISDYPLLYDALPSRYQNAGGTDSFTVPDLRGRMRRTIEPASQVLGYTAGEEGVRLTTAEMPRHSHGITTVNIASGLFETGPFPLFYPTGATPKQTTEEGAGRMHNNMPPYMVVRTGIYTGQT